MNLETLQMQWIKLYDELGKRFDSELMAAPFVSVQEDVNEGAGLGRILLVGKATAGGWGKEQFNSKKDQPLTERLKERRSFTLRHLESTRKPESNPSSFWRFRDSLEEIGCRVIWTNLAKIGSVRRNPSMSLIKRQSELAQQTLRAEIKECKPALIVLVTSTFAAQEVAHPVFGPKNVWQTPDDSIWWRERTQAEPPILWLNHPQIKANTELHHWLEKAQELIG